MGVKNDILGNKKEPLGNVAPTPPQLKPGEVAVEPLDIREVGKPNVRIDEQPKSVPTTLVDAHQMVHNGKGFTYERIAEMTKPQVDEEKLRKKEKREKLMSAISGGISALSNLYFTTKGAPNRGGSTEAIERTNQKWDMLNRDREAKMSAYIASLERARDKDQAAMTNERNWQRQVRMDKAAEEERKAKIAANRAKEQREREIHALNVQLSQGKIDKAVFDAEKARIEAKYVGKVQESVINRNNAAAVASNARALRIQQEGGRFNAWDKDGNKFTFKTKAEADAFAKQHGTWEEKDVVEETNTFKYDKYDNEKKVGASKKTRKVGYAKKIEPTQPKPKEQPKNQQPAQQTKPQSKGGGSKYQDVKI